MVCNLVGVILARRSSNGCRAINQAAGKMKFNKASLKKLGTILNLTLIPVLLFVFFRYASLDELIMALRTVYLPWFALSFAVSMLIIFFSSVRFWFMLRKQGILIQMLQLIGINMGVRFYSFFSPISSIGSIIRFQRLIPVEKVAEGIAAFGANRVFEIMIFLSMGVFWGLTSITQDGLNPAAFLIYLLVVLLALWTAFQVGDFVANWAERKQMVSSSRALIWVYRALGRLLRSLSLYRTFSSTDLLILLGVALLGDLISLFGYAFVALSLHIQISFADLGWIRSLMLLAAFTPITLPGGFGMREVSAIVLMSSMGLSAEQAAAFSLLLYARSLFVALLAGVLELAFNVKSIVEYRKTN